jgi:methionyl-tRNA formyltransferase
MRILFAGTPEIAIPSLEKLSSEFTICGVLTNPDKPKGRKNILSPSPVKEKALEIGLDVYNPNRLNQEFEEIVRGLKPDLLVCIAFGKIFKKSFLDLFPMGGINLHPSLLPVYRGPSPISEAILNGDKTTGLTIQRLALEMDSGNILYQKELALNGTETTLSLTQKVSLLGADAILEVVKNIKNGNVEEWEQDHSRATFCRLTKKEDGKIDWNKDSEYILNRIRAYNPWPIAHTMFLDKSLNILEGEIGPFLNNGKPGDVLEYSKSNGYLVKVGDNQSIYIKVLQLQSKKILDYKSFQNGVSNFVGTRLG